MSLSKADSDVFIFHTADQRLSQKIGDGQEHVTRLPTRPFDQKRESYVVPKDVYKF